MENQEIHKQATIEVVHEQDNNKEETEITKFALGDEYHKFNDDDEVNETYLIIGY